MQVEEILIIKNSNESYGISTEDINQISRVPTLMPLPLRPKGVRGLCAVAGNIVSLLDLNTLLGLPQEVEYEAEKTRLLSLNGHHSSNALLVSEVYNTVEVDQLKIDYIDQPEDPVIAIYKYKDKLVQVISLDILVERLNKVQIEAKEIKNGKIQTEITKEEELNRFLIFSMANENFAIDIEYLQEIIFADIEATEIVGSSDEVVGLITLREELVIVIDLRSYYGFSQKRSDKNRILITSYQGKRIGLLIDEIIDIKNYAATDIEYMDDTVERSKISGVIHEKDSLISFFDHKVLESIFQKHEAFVDESDHAVVQEGSCNTIEMVVFKIQEKEYAFEIESVDEIIDIMETTEVTFSDESVDGVINIRGQIVAIVSLFEKLGIEPYTPQDGKIIICRVDGVRVGFVVDSVSDILHIKESEIREEESDIFTSVLHLDHGRRLVLTMDVDTLVERKEI